MTRRPSPAAIHLLLIVLISRAMLPAGWMPDAHAGLIICSVPVSASAALGLIHYDDGLGHSHQDSDANGYHQDCAFAHLAHLAPPPHPSVLALPMAHGFLAAIDRSRVDAISASVSPGSPRAPPLNA